MDLLVICGPTASGKTALAIELAKRLNGEIVSADSMQIYRELNIGTAKPDSHERGAAPHHMLDVASVTESYSVSRYEEEAASCVDDIISRGRLPIVCGGTGLYIDALIKGSGFLPRDESGELRKELEARWEAEGGEAMLAMLEEVDPESAQRLHINDKKRIIRALEVFKLTGKTISQHNRETHEVKPRYDSLIIGICPEDRGVLYKRIDSRVDMMMERGLLDEIRELYQKGLMVNTAAQAIGYKELFGYLSGESTLQEGIELIKRKSRNYAKRQLTWFRRDERVNWIYYTENDNLETVVNKATNFLHRSGVVL